MSNQPFKYIAENKILAKHKRVIDKRIINFLPFIIGN
tara:strand:- start:260 stop:370 length:111 start_codon:yes stop_codon:yes gene_type:complete